MTANPSLPDAPVTDRIVVSSDDRTLPSLRELWDARELAFFLTWRDIKVKYKQSVFGLSWAVFKPLLTMLVFTGVFSTFINVPTEGIPYPLLLFSALVPWQFFSQSLETTAGTIIAGKSMIQKVYFPRLVLPISATLSNLVDLSVSFVILLGIMVWYGHIPTPAITLLPLFLLLSIATSLGVGMWLAGMSAKYRDVRHLVPFLVQTWLFLTPVVYPLGVVPDWLRPLYFLNPMVGVVEAFRWSLLGNRVFPFWPLVASLVVVIPLVVLGVRYFSRTQQTFADVV